MGNESTEPETQKVLFNVNNFLCIRQRKAVSIRLCLRHLKGAPRHLGLEHTNRPDLLHRQYGHAHSGAGTKHAAIVMEYTTNNMGGEREG